MTGRFRVLLREVCISVHELFCNSECGMRKRDYRSREVREGDTEVSRGHSRSTIRTEGPNI
jgi:hypothetical protein